MSFTIVMSYVLPLIIGLSSSYIFSYFKEKGRNLATKEDLKKITKDIEEVKNEVSYKAMRDNNYLQTRKEKLISFVYCGVVHRNLIDKMIYAFDKVSDINYIRNLYDTIYEEKLNAEVKFYECLLFIKNIDERKALSSYYNDINDFSVEMLKIIHELDVLAYRYDLFIKMKLYSNPSIKDSIENDIKSLVQTFEQNKIRLNNNIRSAVTNYTYFIGDLSRKS